MTSVNSKQLGQISFTCLAFYLLTFFDQSLSKSVSNAKLAAEIFKILFSLRLKQF